MKVKSYYESNGLYALIVKVCDYFIGNINAAFYAYNPLKVYIGGGSRIYGKGHVVIHGKFYAKKGLWLDAVCNYQNVKHRPRIVFGDNFNCSNNFHVAAINCIEIGKNVLVGSNVLITDHSHSSPGTNFEEVSPINTPLYSKGSVHIGDNCWIGDGAVVLPGSKVGVGCIIGANSVVSGYLPDHHVCVGSPAKPIKKLI